MKKPVKRLVSGLLAVLLLALTILPVFAESESGSAIHIRTVQDLLDLQTLCNLDTATQGKTVVLENDLDLTGADFTGLPVFCGTFDGQGHTISGMNLTGSGSVQGLVRYLEESGTLKNLNVSGTAAPSDYKTTIGGLVGINRGMVKSCNFSGTVSADTEAGGIAGRNEQTGQIISCTNSATVTAKRMVGGVAGQNLGSIIMSGNSGSINTTETDNETPDFSNGVDPALLTAETENKQALPSVSDIGGVAGYSSGILQSCENSGEVGYPHIGYNVGGIVGRQTGYLSGCANRGTVQGRKDVGGIAGQLEPDLTVRYGEDKLNTLYDELDSLQNLMSTTLEDAKGVNSNVSAQMDALTGTTRTAKENTSALANSLNDWAENTANTVNNTASSYAKAVDDLKLILDNAETALKQADAAEAALRQLVADGRVTAKLTEQSLAQLNQAIDSFSQASQQAQSAKEHAQKALQVLIEALGSDSDMQAAWNELVQAMQDLADAANAMQQAAQEIHNILAGIPDDPDQQDNLNTLTEQYERYQQAVANMQQAAAALAEELAKDDPDWQIVKGYAAALYASAMEAADALSKMEAAAAAIGGTVAPKLQEQLEILHDQANAATDAAQRITDAIEKLQEGLSPDNIPQEARDEINAANNDLQEAMQSMQNGLQQLSDAVESLRAALDSAGKLPDDVKAVVEPLEQDCKTLCNTIKDVQGVINRLAGQPALKINSPGSTVTAKSDALDTSLNDLINGISDLNSVMNSSGDTLTNDFSAINTQFGKVVDTLRSLTDTDDTKLKDHFEDVSKDSTAQENGMLVSSANSGSVQGDTAVGGIAGSLSGELTFDPEDDITKQGSRSPDATMQVSLILLDCTNTGEVTAKKSYAGGMAGRMDYGYMARCENYGTITSEDGDYVGGLAGLSHGALHDSWVRCALSGKEYIGGAAGYGKEIIGCTTMVEITDGESRLGALAGVLDDEDNTLSENRIVNEKLGAVDGVTYAAQATPDTFEEIAADTAAPAQFARLELTFTADGKTVAVVPFRYGQGITSLPDIPAKDGYVAQWPELDYSHLTYSQTVEAEYINYTTALADNEDVPNILVDGSFSSKAVVTTTQEETEIAGDDGRNHAGTVYTVAVSDPVFGSPACTVHYRKPDSGTLYKLWIQQADGSWQKQDYTKDGSYLLIPAENGTVTFMIEKIPFNWTVIVIAVVGVILMLLFAVIWIRRDKKRHSLRPYAKNKKTEEADAKEEENHE